VPKSGKRSGGEGALAAQTDLTLGLGGERLLDFFFRFGLGFLCGRGPSSGHAASVGPRTGCRGANVPSSSTAFFGPFSFSFFLFSRAFFIAIAAAALPGILSAAGPAQH